jgi:anti-anti-sigma factor
MVIVAAQAFGTKISPPFSSRRYEMRIAQRIEGDVTVFLPEGRIDTQAATELDDTLQAAVSAGSNNLVVDMAGVDYISSAGLRTLAAVLVKSRGEGGDLKLSGLNERVTRVLKIVGFDVLMSIHDTSEAAIADFSSSGTS